MPCCLVSVCQSAVSPKDFYRSKHRLPLRPYRYASPCSCLILCVLFFFFLKSFLPVFPYQLSSLLCNPVPYVVWLEADQDVYFLFLYYNFSLKCYALRLSLSRIEDDRICFLVNIDYCYRVRISMVNLITDLSILIGCAHVSLMESAPTLTSAICRKWPGCRFYEYPGLPKSTPRRFPGVLGFGV